MSKDSKPTKKATVSKRRPTKKATVSKRRPMKKDTVSNDSKPAEESAVSNDSKPTKKATVSKRRPMKKDTVSNDSKPAEESAVSNDSKKPSPRQQTRKAVSNDSKTVSNDSKPAEENTVSNDIKPTEKGAAGETPVFDFTKLMSQFRLPGVDFAAFVDRERKNIEALVKANRIAFEGWQRLVRRQAEMLEETMKKVVADAGQEDVKEARGSRQRGFRKGPG